jgi:hypothetical protein
MTRNATFAAIILMAASGCASIPAPAVAPFQTSSGGLGFTLDGLAQFTRDETAIEQKVRESLVRACGGEIEKLEITFLDATSRGGVPHTAYTGRAECKR